MATEQKLQTVTLEAGDDLSAIQYYFVSIAADGQVDATGDGLEADGVLQNDPAAAGRAASVGISGITKVVVGGAVTRGGNVASDSSGRAVNPSSGDYLMGVALATATTAGEIVSMLLKGRPGVHS